MTSQDATKVVLGIATAIVFFFLLHTLLSLGKNSESTYFDYDDIKDIAIQYNGEFFLLDSEQQEDVIGILNDAIPATEELLNTSPETPEFEKVIIHSHKGIDYDILPLGYVNNKLIFQVVRFKAQAYHIEDSGGELRSIFRNRLNIH